MKIVRSMTRFARITGLAMAGCLLSALPVAAQEATDIARLAEFVRWGGLVVSIPIIIGLLVLIKVIENLSIRLGGRFSNRRPTIQKFESALRFLIYVVGTVVCIGLSVRLDPTAMTVLGGSLAFAVGFAMRDLVAAFIAGVTIMFDRPFQVGDRVAYAGEYGDILKIGLRSVRMNTLDHNIITIPNNKILTDVTSSGNYGQLEMQVAMDFYIGSDQDVERAMAIVREACLTSPYAFLGQPAPILLKQVFHDGWLAFHLKARPYVFDCKYEKPFETDVHLRVNLAFREAGIRPPAVMYRRLEGSDTQASVTGHA